VSAPLIAGQPAQPLARRPVQRGRISIRKGGDSLDVGRDIGRRSANATAAPYIKDLRRELKGAGAGAGAYGSCMAI
jgi:hypothetical protein